MRKSRNHMNICKAVWHGLRAQRDPEDVARARGRKLVDVSELRIVQCFEFITNTGLSR